jgi:hypothetical protein
MSWIRTPFLLSLVCAGAVALALPAAAGGEPKKPKPPIETTPDGNPVPGKPAPTPDGEADKLAPVAPSAGGTAPPDATLPPASTPVTPDTLPPPSTPPTPPSR